MMMWPPIFKALSRKTIETYGHNTLPTREALMCDYNIVLLHIHSHQGFLKLQTGCQITAAVLVCLFLWGVHFLNQFMAMTNSYFYERSICQFFFFPIKVQSRGGVFNWFIPTDQTKLSFYNDVKHKQAANSDVREADIAFKWKLLLNLE